MRMTPKRATPNSVRQSRICTQRRAFLSRGATAAALFVMPGILQAQQSDVWSAADAYDALSDDLIRLIDIRSRAEWTETGVAQAAWPVSLHEDRFPERLFEAKVMANGRPVALICATGGRSGYVLRSLRQGGYTGFFDVSEGMLGSDAGPGWIKAGLPIVPAFTALQSLPPSLA